ncbi:MAG: DNA repair protein RadC [Deltaproteobacteria bacterium]|nr:DNA repair protein RadC [Deltaproteobacteria bacterium]
MIKLLTAEKLISDRDHKKRLKERFKNGALEGFHNNEILELLLTYAVARKDVKPLSAALIHRFKSFRAIFDASAEELKATPGIGENAAVLIKLIKDVAGVYLKERMMGKDVIRCPKDVLDYLNLTLSGERVEKFIAIYLNGRNELLAIETLHEGTINQTVVYPRKAIEKAFKHNARAIIFVHNHPSGDATPSGVDRQLTKVLDRAALAVDLIVHDHIIIGKDRHFSARESGWIIGCPTQLQMTMRR